MDIARQRMKEGGPGTTVAPSSGRKSPTVARSRAVATVCVMATNTNADEALDISGSARPSGPAVLVLVLVYCKDRLLLLRRGCEPYSGKWAPPGGFVEYGESVEAAAVREVWEETRLRLNTAQLLPKGVMSVPRINQVHHVFVAYLDDPAAIAPAAVPPESLEVRWFSQQDCMAADAGFWEPGANVDYEQLFEILRQRRADLFQWNDDYQRIIAADGQIRYVWHRDDPSK